MIKCYVDSCNRKADCFYENNKYCLKHYKQLIRNGTILNRTRYDKNEIIVVEDHAEIILYNIFNKEKGRALIDIKNIEKVKNIKWKLDKSGYVTNNKHKLQNIIMNFKGNRFQQVDHKNRNKLDNQEYNLEIVSAQQNVINRGIQKNNKSGVPGVSFDISRNMWYAEIQYNHVAYNLGLYRNFNDAVAVRKDAEIEYFGKIIER